MCGPPGPGPVPAPGAADRAVRLAHLARLDSAARRARFLGLGSSGDPPEPGLALGCWLDGRLRGLAELYPLPATRGTAELALSVEPAFQGRGLGTALLDRIVVLARNRGLTRLSTFCGADNRRLLAMLRRVGARLQLDGGEARARLDLLPASPATLALEAIDLWEPLASRLAVLGCGWLAGAAARAEPPPLRGGSGA